MDYLEATGQQASIADLPIADVAAMSRLAEQIDRETVPALPSRIAEVRAAHTAAHEQRSPPLLSTPGLLSSCDAGWMRPLWFPL